MNLDEAQRTKVATWVAEGLKLSEIQSRIGKELGLSMTYMEVRLLVDDLKLTLKDPEPAKPLPTLNAPPTKPSAAAPSPLSPTGAPGGEAAPAAGSVSVTVDQLARPGAMVSGKVTFSDGHKAEWYLDQMGRLGVVPGQQGYKPSQADVQEFQLQLQDELAKMGI